ncbi:MAG: hypothetical protein R3E58_06730 [Phycisphaerae bacterium]
MISKGLLAEAQLLASQNVDALANYAHQGVPIVGLEPSCVSALTDELPQLSNKVADRIAANTMMLNRSLADSLKKNRIACFREGAFAAIRYHGHCQKAAIRNGRRDDGAARDL